ncbi:hypothetical protein [Rhodococcus qingshengii]|uniref:hypothetical protein n=1 Tax=Rhodococcus qingshengii TaxID=334542 RepID=UPI0035D86D33
MEKPSYFDAQPGEILDWLRGEFPDDVLLGFFQLVTHRGIEEACDDIMLDQEKRNDSSSHDFAAGMRYAKELIDPRDGGGNYPSQIMCNKHVRCPSVPRCKV